MAMASLAKYESGVGGLSDGASVAKHDDIGAYVERGYCDGIDPAGAGFKRQRGFRADRTAGGEAQVGDENVRTSLRHGDRLRRIENIRSRQEVLFMGQVDHLNLQGVAHSGFFQVLPEGSVDQSDSRKVLHARKADSGDAVEEAIEVAKRVGAIYSCEHGRSLDDWQDFLCHFHHDVIGIAISQ